MLNAVVDVGKICTNMLGPVQSKLDQVWLLPQRQHGISALSRVLSPKLQFYQPLKPVIDMLEKEIPPLSVLMGGRQTMGTLPILLDRLMQMQGGGKPSTVCRARFACGSRLGMSGICQLKGRVTEFSNKADKFSNQIFSPSTNGVQVQIEPFVKVVRMITTMVGKLNEFKAQGGLISIGNRLLAGTALASGFPVRDRRDLNVASRLTGPYAAAVRNWRNPAHTLNCMHATQDSTRSAPPWASTSGNGI